MEIFPERTGDFRSTRRRADHALRVGVRADPDMGSVASDAPMPRVASAVRSVRVASFLRQLFVPAFCSSFLLQLFAGVAGVAIAERLQSGHDGSMWHDGRDRGGARPASFRSDDRLLHLHGCRVAKG
jgi:hypothetical protein